MTECKCKCKNNEMVTKEECEKAETSAWWDGVLNTLKNLFWRRHASRSRRQASGSRFAIE